MSADSRAPSRALACCGTGVLALSLVATASVGAQPVAPPIRKIESAQAVSTMPLGAITSVRQLPDGRILLNDGARRRLLLLDSTLAVQSVVLDSLTEVENAYGTRAGALVPYVGDSTLFIDPATYAMLVIDPVGRIVRVRSVPRAQDVAWITNNTGQFGFPAFDAKGRLVHRVPAQPARPSAPPPSGVPYIPQQPDSAFVVGVHLDTRRVDTLGAVRVVKTNMTIRVSADGGYNVNQTSSPMPLLDDWAVLADGTVAFVRGRDYRVEYLGVDGASTSSEKLPYEWVRFSEEDKTRMMDSIGTAQKKRELTNFVSQVIAWSNTLNKPFPKEFTVPEGYTLPQGLPGDWILPKGMSFPAGYTFACPPSVAGVAPPSAPPAPASPAAGAGAPTGAGKPSCVQNPYADWYGNGYTPPAPTYRPQTVFPANELPDYRPPLPPTAARADGDGNLWIRTIPPKPIPGGQVFDIVSRKGVLTDRIQLPPGYSLAGFGRGRVVYLATRDGNGLHLARVRLR